MAKNWYKEHPFHQGVFAPRNPHKWENTNPIRFMSDLEFKYMTYFDKNSNVIKVGSENVIVPYIHPIKSLKYGKDTVARYFVDFFVEMSNNQCFLIEVKPEKQKLEVLKEARKKGIRESQKSYIYRMQQKMINTKKWESAEKYCISKGWKFLILTEKDIDKF